MQLTWLLCLCPSKLYCRDNYWRASFRFYLLHFLKTVYIKSWNTFTSSCSLVLLQEERCVIIWQGPGTRIWTTYFYRVRHRAGWINWVYVMWAIFVYSCHVLVDKLYIWLLHKFMVVHSHLPNYNCFSKAVPHLPNPIYVLKNSSHHGH